MSDWIPFEDATYSVERAFLVTPDKTATEIEDALITVYTGRGGKRLSGSGLVHNILLVQLLEETKTPQITAGKVFSPKVKSTLQFSPVTSWDQIPESEFDDLVSQLKILE
jgi:hypothetical protein